MKILPRKHRDYLRASASLFAIHDAYKAREVWGENAPKTITYKNMLLRRTAVKKDTTK